MGGRSAQETEVKRTTSLSSVVASDRNPFKLTWVKKEELGIIRNQEYFIESQSQILSRETLSDSQIFAHGSPVAKGMGSCRMGMVG